MARTSIGYDSHTADVVNLYFIESFTFLVYTPEAAVAPTCRLKRDIRKPSAPRSAEQYRRHSADPPPAHLLIPIQARTGPGRRTPASGDGGHAHLPTLNADIIDYGVARGDTGLHPAHRRRHACGHAGPGVRQCRRHLFRGMRGHGYRARHPPRPCAPVKRLLPARDGKVRRTVADHAHHQRRPAGPDARGDERQPGDHGADHVHRRCHHGHPGPPGMGGPRRRRPDPRCVHDGRDQSHDPRIPRNAGADRHREPRLREQITGIRVVRAFVREPEEIERRRRQRSPPPRRCESAGYSRWCSRSSGRHQRHDGRDHLGRWTPDRRREDGDRPGADRADELCDADLDGRHDGVLPGDDGSARRGLRRADHGGPRDPDQRRTAAVSGRFTSDPAEVEFHDAAFAYPAPPTSPF